MDRSSGSRASTSAAEARRTAAQPGPLSTHWWSTIRTRSIRSPRAIRSRCAESSWSPAGELGARKASRVPDRRTSTTPAPHSCRTVPGVRTPPVSSHAWAEPRVGWPANGICPPGVKMRSP
ncbi:hypothetical protein SALBM311S_01516 [Streptomyces alboniger]